MDYPSLPLELHEAIIDIVALDWNPTVDLVACSSTCKAWSIHTRKRIFAHVYAHAKNVDRFMEILPGVAPLVRTLEFSANQQSSDALVTFASRLLKVTHLCLYSLDWTTLGDSAFDVILNGFPLVTTLNFRDHQFHTLPQLCRVVASFPNLNSLTCHQVKLLSATRDVSACLPVPEPLRALKINAPDSPVVDWILAQTSPLQIQKLELGNWEAIPLSETHAERLLQRLGTSLRYLRLKDLSVRHESRGEHPNHTHTHGLRSSSLFIPGLDLSLNSNLESLTLHTKHPPLCQWVIDTLSRITSSTKLTSVTISDGQGGAGREAKVLLPCPAQPYPTLLQSPASAGGQAMNLRRRGAIVSRPK